MAAIEREKIFDTYFTSSMILDTLHLTAGNYHRMIFKRPEKTSIVFLALKQLSAFL